MKMPKHLYNQMAWHLGQILESESVSASLIETYTRSRLSPMRFRWDLLYRTPCETFRRDWFNEVYQTMDDTHIDTALRHYMKQSPVLEWAARKHP